MDYNISTSNILMYPQPDSWTKFSLEGNTTPLPENLAALLASVIDCFPECFGQNFNSSAFRVYPCKGNPITFRESSEIGLSARGRR